jgi:hypothetical protein
MDMLENECSKFIKRHNTNGLQSDKPCPNPVFSKQNAYAGNTNVQGYLNTNWFKFSQNVGLASTARGGSTWTIVNKKINVFGSYAGAPAGYGQPPKNTFN